MDHWFVKELESQLAGQGDLWTKKGEALMSGVDTLNPEVNGGTMIMGLNPGGVRLPPLNKQVGMIFEHCKSAWSCYQTQCWHYAEGHPHKYCDGCGSREGVKFRPHQTRVQNLATHVGIDLTKTLSVNAFFVETRDATELASVGRSLGFDSYREFFKKVYLPFHLKVIERAGIRRVICLGTGRGLSSFALLGDALGGLSDDVWKPRYPEGRQFKAGSLHVFGVPHPSWHTLSDRGVDSFKRWYKGTA